MAPATFYLDVTRWFTLVMHACFLVIEIWALVSCLRQRADAFPVVGSVSKNGWLAILGGSVLFTLVCGLLIYSPLSSILAFIAITAAGVYMLDMRPALREATNGSGNW